MIHAFPCPPRAAPSSADAKTPSTPTPGATLGLEMEMVVARRGSGLSHPVVRYFDTLAGLKRGRDATARVAEQGGRDIAVLGEHGVSGVDNGFNLLETSFAPVAGQAGGLDRLARQVWRELADAQAALAAEDAVLLNASEHPACTLDAEWYRRVRAPRPIYDELVDHRGWLHRVGIDAKAQNSPCTSVPAALACRALNVTLGLAPAAIALFANSPLQAGRETGLKENRLTMWDRMFRHARYAGDHYLQQLPPQPFEDLGDHFRWMFGPATTSRALPAAPSQDYKRAAPLYLRGAPCLARFLATPRWSARDGATGRESSLVPQAAHFVYSQFAHFLDARWRYRLDAPLDLRELREMWDRPGGLEILFERLGAQGYIEGRAPGAVFPDRQLADEAGADIARSAPLAPSALQLGLLRNLAQAEALMRDWGWHRLRALRQAAIRDALADDAVHALARDVVQVAHDGLASEDRPWLAYARHCVATRSTGADRMLRLWRSGGDSAARLGLLARWRALDIPS